MFKDPIKFVYTDNLLQQMLYPNVNTHSVLSAEEEKELSQEKKSLDDIYKKIKKKPHEKEQLKNRAKRIIIKINDLSAKFLRAYNYNAATTEYAHLYGICVAILDANDSVKTDVQLNYSIALIADWASPKIKDGVQLLQDVIDRIANDSKSDPYTRARKLAIAEYALAQYYVRNDNIEEADQHLTKSYQLRKAYNAPENEFERIKYLRAVIAYQSKKPEAEKLLLECYQHRRGIDPTNPNLQPIYLALIDMMRKKGDRNNEIKYLTELLRLQIAHNIRPRDLISTRLQLLRAMTLKTPDDDYWQMLTQVAQDLDQLPVQAESLDVGRNYLDLVNTRVNTLLPPTWSVVAKRKFYFETLGVIHKAKAHTRAASNSSDPNPFLTELEALEQTTLRQYNYFQDPSTVPSYKILPIHPEDQAEIDSLASRKNQPDTGSTGEQLRALSQFSSEVNHALLSEAERLLTPKDFLEMSAEGRTNPFRLRTAQGGINTTFRDNRTLDEMIQQLISQPEYTLKIEPIEIGIYKEKVFSFDTRRLIAHQKAKEVNPGVYIRYRKIDGSHLQERIAAIFSPRPWNGLVTATRYGGKHSESNPYINPLFRTQLEEKVNSSFKPYPSDRAGADANGFPTDKLAAKKIYSFLDLRSKEGSVRAKACIAELKKIIDPQAAYQYLINLKKEFPTLEQDIESQDSLLPVNEIPQLMTEEPVIAEQEIVGPRWIVGWQLEDVKDEGNCYYLAIADQLQLIAHPFTATIPEGTATNDSLRLLVQGASFTDTAWAGDDEIFLTAKKLNIIIAVVDTRYPEYGYRCYYLEDDQKIINVEGDLEMPHRPILRIAATGVHFLSVISNPGLAQGALRDSFNEKIVGMKP